MKNEMLEAYRKHQNNPDLTETDICCNFRQGWIMAKCLAKNRISAACGVPGEITNGEASGLKQAERILYNI